MIPTRASDFDPANVSPETAAFNEMLAAARGNLLAVPASADELRRRFAQAASAAVPFVSQLARWRNFGEGASLEARVFSPAEPAKAILVFVHGGGWTIGAPDEQDERLEDLARQGIAVVAPRYGLAPERPFPEGLDDVESCLRWVLDNGPAEFGTDAVFVGGESAGANLGAAVALRLRDRPACRPVRGMTLLYGAYDLTQTPGLRAYGDPPGLLGMSLMRWFFDQYAAEGLRLDPQVSPFHADLHNMPPAFFAVGTRDVLLDDTLFMHCRWQAAGNQSALMVAPGGVHAFNAYPLTLARAANAAVASFIKSLS